MSTEKMTPRQALGEAEAAAERARVLVGSIAPADFTGTFADVADAFSMLEEALAAIRSAREGLP